MKPTGFTYSHRAKWFHPMFNDLLEAAIWSWMIDSAAWEDCQVNFNGDLVRLKRGQLVTTVKFISTGFRLTNGVTRGFLKKLKNEQTVELSTNKRYTLITICNYDKYQGENFLLTNRLQTDRKPLTNRSQTDNNNKKEVKEGKEIKEGKITPPPPFSGGEKKHVVRPHDVGETVWKDFIAHRKAKRATVTDTVVSTFRREAGRAGWTLEQAMAESCSRGWQGFRAEWVLDDQQKGTDYEKHRNSSSGGSKRDRALAAIQRGLNSIPDPEPYNPDER